MTARGLIVSAPRSSSGKTIVTLGLLAALRRRGFAVRAAKAGPDYIDPAFHAGATSHPSLNLDTWAMPPALLDRLMNESASAADFLLIEGAMGLFDGLPGPAGRTGAAADLAARFDLPALLVLDVSGQSQTAAALVRGLATHDPAVRIAGVVLNRVGSERHRRLASNAIATLGIPVLGALPRNADLTLPERHLGLVQASEHFDLPGWIERAGAMVEQHIDIDRVAAATATIASPLIAQGSATALAPPGNRIALAADAAFSFIYPHVVDGWRRAGAEIVRFSPLADEAPADDCDCCWLPGGYPELHAGTLAAAARFRSGLANFAATRPMHGECGGYMVLGEGLIDATGTRHAMTALLGHVTSFAERRLHLGYREAELRAPCAIGAVGARVRGHEFHYASLLSVADDAPLADLMDGEGRRLGPSGGRRGQVTGTFFHAIAPAE
ncbi:MAG: cobyrinate a,c-diamide synthase [Hyphomicrobiales bacterium]|nr:cobyrinate a,c-diamide synthase [Hyphomicrobiales bacterium]MBV8823781.1 cobyrinate a,c-diamide synthase [Hyphomicrobiales bacterium]MBV9428457.1 cobyrinate a,c-diamide synthase [Bradyrhizobiaceae bacterium]